MSDNFVIKDSSWVPGRNLAIIGEVINMSDFFIENVLKNYPFYRKKLSNTTQTISWLNNCEKCKALQGHFYLLEEIFESPFFPYKESLFENTLLTKIDLSESLNIYANHIELIDPEHAHLYYTKLKN